MIGPDSVLSARTGLAAVEIDGEIVLYDDGERRLHRLNPTAATVWRCLDGRGRLADIAHDIAEVYRTPAEQVLADVVQTARHLAAQGLVGGGD